MEELKSRQENKPNRRICARRLREAARVGDLDLLRELITAGAETDKANGQGFTALMFASMGVMPEHGSRLPNHAACVAALIDAGAEVDTVSSDGATALMYACMYGREACVTMLLDANADPHAIDCRGRTALHIAQEGRASSFGPPGELWRR